MKAPHVVVNHTADGPVVTWYPSKKGARLAGQQLREAGASAFVFDETTYTRFIQGQITR